VVSGVKQECCMSLQVAFRSSQTSYIADLEFAVDIALISSKIEHLKAKTSQLENYASRAGLKLNAHKCQCMKINNKQQERLMIIKVAT